MKTNHQTKVINRNEHPNTSQQIGDRVESKVKITASSLIHWSGLGALLAGLIYIGIQPIHPSENLSSVTTDAWAIVSYLSLAMALFGLIGIGGIYARQVKEVGWLGLAGFLMLSLFWIATTAFTFAEAFILPLLATNAPMFVEGFLGIFGGYGSEVNLGVLPAIAPIAAGLYIFGGLLLGIATLRAGILPRLAAGMLIFGAIAPLASSVFSHPFDRILAVPMGIALVWLGFALLTERREKAL